MTTEQKPTLRDVARAAHAGVSTVSLALRDDPRIRAETKAHIRKVADRLGYQSNALVANLMAQLRASKSGGTRPRIALVDFSGRADEFEALNTFQLWEDSVRERCAACGYAFQDYAVAEMDIAPGDFARSLREEGVRGVILAGLREDGTLPPRYSDLWETFPSAVLGGRPRNPPLHFSCNDQYATAQECMHRLAERGYQRPGLVINAAADAMLERRFTAGFREAQSRLMPGVPIPVHAFDEARENDFQRWLDVHCPDVLIALHAEVREWVDHAGLRVPEDIGLAHLDVGAGVSAGWSGMDHHSYAVGEAAVDLVVGQIHRNECGVPAWAKCVLNSSSWVDGGTTRSLHAVEARPQAEAARVDVPTGALLAN